MAEASDRTNMEGKVDSNAEENDRASLMTSRKDSHLSNDSSSLLVDDLPECYKNASESLTNGIKANFLSDINRAKIKVNELIHTQDVLRESVQQEMTNLDEYKLTDDISEFAADLRKYHSKLLNIKKDIQYVNDRVGKMKKKAIKLQIGKEKEELHKAHQKQKELEFQKQLTAKPAVGSYDD